MSHLVQFRHSDDLRRPNSVVSLPRMGEIPAGDLRNMEDWFRQAFYNTNWTNNLIRSLDWDDQVATKILTINWEDTANSSQSIDIMHNHVVADISDLDNDFANVTNSQVQNILNMGGNTISSNDWTNIANIPDGITIGTDDWTALTTLPATQAQVATNTSNISTNTSNIATNTGNIATNTGNISTNTGNISTLQADVAALQSSPPAHTHTASEITDFDTEVSNNPSVVANSGKVSNATHTGDVTGSGALTIASNAVTTAKINNLAVTTGKIANDAVNSAKVDTTIPIFGSVGNSDLNNYNTASHSGIYFYDGGGLSNEPAAFNDDMVGILFHFTNGTEAIQCVIGYESGTGSPGIYSRKYESAAWSAWHNPAVYRGTSITRTSDANVPDGAIGYDSSSQQMLLKEGAGGGSAGWKQIDSSAI